ncbi:mitochondrial fission process protein 1 [Toxorhynchites rutilus septentrionalis]|uniref:mitochondrial fission process protein 1 n=1 Tax=Toxorhynchites rutilus septentrionalis TaxID=329112 RepID=UPI0024791FA9|nr:mitochondrial fission process protein 1 [Toxorhynchites rutilus septentrionalis]
MSATEKDIYRDTLVRYLGYANEVGEAFRPIVKKIFVHASYGVAVSYVLADTADKSRKQYAKPEALGGGSRGAAIASGDTLIWQMFASVIIPGFTINRICWISKKALAMGKIKGPVKMWAPTALGLLAIPFIIHPIDHAMDFVMDETYRKFFK